MTDETVAERPEYLQATEWSVPHFLFVFGAGFVGALLATIVAFVVWGQELTVTSFAFVFGAQSGTSLLAMWWLSRTRGSGSLRADFGLRIRLSDWWGLFAGVGLQIGVALLMAPFIRLFFPEGPPQQEVAEVASGSSGAVDVILVVTMVGLLAPLTEEMMFRGMLLSRAVRSLTRTWAIVATAGAFAAVHLFDANAIAVIPGLFIVGVVLAFVALRRGDLSLAIMLHAGVNLTAALLLIFGDQLLDWAEQQQENLEQQLEGVVRLGLGFFGIG